MRRKPGRGWSAGAAALAATLALTGCSKSERQAPEARARPVEGLGQLGYEGDFPDAAGLAAAVARSDRTSWFGLYLGGKKVGYARLESRSDDAGLHWTVDATLQLGGETANRVTVRETRVYAPRPPYRLQTVDLREESSDSLLERRIDNGPTHATVIETVDGATRKSRIGRSAETVASVVAEYAVEPIGLQLGDRTRVVDFDSDALRDHVTVVEVLERRQQLWQGVPTEIAVLALSTQGTTGATRAIVASGGHTLQSSIGEGIELRLEEQHVATSGVKGFDPVADAIPVEGTVPDPQRLTALTLQVQGPEGFPLLSRRNQRVTRGSDGARVQLLRGRGDRVTPAQRARALVPSSQVDADDPALLALAARIVGGETDREERVRLLVDWVHRELDKELATNLSRASQVLARRAGDCTEHALLLVALSRAAGIPARELSGLVYLGAEAGRFGWHAWVEVEVDGAWLPVDPSLGQAPADATHLALGVGDDASWVAGLGTLRLRVIAAAPAAE